MIRTGGRIKGVKAAGGIGFLLSNRIATYKWDEAWSIIFLIVVMVYIIDAISARIRAIDRRDHASIGIFEIRYSGEVLIPGGVHTPYGRATEYGGMTGQVR